MDGRLVSGKTPTLRNSQKLLLKDNYPSAGPVDCRTLCRKYPTRAICTASPVTSPVTGSRCSYKPGVAGQRH